MNLCNILVTGGLGFFRSSIIKALNARGITELTVVDDLTDKSKLINITSCTITDYLDISEFRTAMATDFLDSNVKRVIDLKYTMLKEILHFYGGSIRIYSSLMDVVNEKVQQNDPKYKTIPLNVHSFSKSLFDQYVARQKRPQIVGLRYFDVYGPGEQHNIHRASMVYEMHKTLKCGDEIYILGSDEGYEPAMLSRDFIHVDDVAKVNMWFLEHLEVDGIFDVGTGRLETDAGFDGEMRSLADVVKEYVYLAKAEI
ncbi:hypothetical protein BDV12DRAFT_190547 [Aspergillus spectabilis]